MPDITGVDAFTISLWIYPIATSNNAAFAWDNYSTTPRFACLIKPNFSGSLSIDVIVNDTGGSRLGTTLSTGAWAHIVVTRTGTSTTSYRNNVALSPVTVGTGSFTVPNIRFGCHYYSGSNNEFYNCRLADFGMWNSVLTAAQINSLYKGASARSVAPGNLLRFVSFERSRIEEITGATLSLIDAPVAADGPPLVRRRARIWRPNAAAAAAVPTLWAQSAL